MTPNALYHRAEHQTEVDCHRNLILRKVYMPFFKKKT